MEIQEVDMTKDQEEQDAKEKEDEFPMASQLSLEAPVVPQGDGITTSVAN
jgi:hypothetical protein